MQPKNFLILAGVTVLSVGLAVNAVMSRDVPVTARPAGEALEPGLLDRANEVRTIKITGPGTTTMTLKAAENGWQLVEKSGYPAMTQKARDLVLQLGNLQLVEAKTAQPERLARLELDDPGTAEAKSRLIELLDQEGQPIAVAVVGKTRHGLYGGGRSGVYVRRAGEPQAWLAAGSLELPSDALDLVDMQVIDLPQAEVARVTLGAGTGDALALHRPNAETTAFTVDAPIPEGRTVDQTKVEEVTGMLAALSMQDVKPAAELAMPPDAPRSRIETFDGLVVEVALAKMGEGDAAERWLTLSASAKEEPPAPAATAPAPVPAATPEASDGAPPAEAAAAPAKAATAAERAAELQARFSGWAFKVAPYLGDRVATSLDGLLADPAGAS